MFWRGGTNFGWTMFFVLLGLAALFNTLYEKEMLRKEIGVLEKEVATLHLVTEGEQARDEKRKREILAAEVASDPFYGYTRPSSIKEVRDLYLTEEEKSQSSVEEEEEFEVLVRLPQDVEVELVEGDPSIKAFQVEGFHRKAPSSKT